MLVAFFGWWYGAGWRQQGDNVMRGYAGLFDMFSFSLLLQTLFSPFRQISAGSVGGPLGVQMHAFFDKTISRFIGALVRFAVIIAGLIITVCYSVVAGVRIVAWPLLPLLPIVGFVLWLVLG